jgi:hypothetical protein
VRDTGPLKCLHEEQRRFIDVPGGSELGYGAPFRPLQLPLQHFIIRVVTVGPTTYLLQQIFEHAAWAGLRRGAHTCPLKETEAALRSFFYRMQLLDLRKATAFATTIADNACRLKIGQR